VNNLQVIREASQRRGENEPGAAEIEQALRKRAMA